MRKIKNKLLSGILPVILFIAVTPVHAQLSDSIKNELRNVSARMFADKNSNYIIVDALTAGYILPDKGYRFVYMHDSIAINGRLLSEPERTLYANKIAEFYSLSNEFGKHSFSLTNYTPLKLKDIFNRSSFFRNPTKPNIKKPEWRSEFVNLLASDKQIDTSANYIVKYTVDGFYINNVSLDFMQSARYVKFINDHGFKPKEKGDQFLMNKSDAFIVSNSVIFSKN